MDENKLRFRVGIVVVFTLLVAGLMIFLVSGGSVLPINGQYQLNIRFPAAGGISAGTPVRKFGKLIGRVDEVKIVDDGVLVTVSIDDEYRIPKTDVAEISSSLIGGDTAIEFVSRSQQAQRNGQPQPEAILMPQPMPPANGTAAHGQPEIHLAAMHQNEPAQTYQPGDTLEGQVRPDPVQILVDMQSELKDTVASLGAAGQSVANVANRIDTILAQADIERLQRILATTETALGNFSNTMESLNNVLGDQQMQAQLRQGISDLPLAIRDVRTTMQQVGSAADEARQNLDNLKGLTGPLGKRGDQIAASMQSAARNLDHMLAQIANFTRSINNREGTLGQLIHNREMYDTVARILYNVEDLTRRARPIVQDLGVFADKIARQPSRLGARGAIYEEAPIKQ